MEWNFRRIQTLERRLAAAAMLAGLVALGCAEPVPR
jgi:hypothetical protein